MAPRISNSTRHAIIEYSKMYSARKIGKLVKCHFTSVARILRDLKKNDVKEIGRKRLLSQADNRYIKLLSKRNRRKTLPEIASDFNVGRQDSVSHSSIRRALQKNNLNGRVALKKPLLRKQNIEKRLKFAVDHINWTPAQWDRVLWSDESKFEIFGTKRRVYVRRGKDERTKMDCIIPTVKHGGGSVMVWGAMCSSGVLPLVKIHGIMLKEHYHTILSRKALPGGKQLLGPGLCFQQDNDPKHTAIINKKYLDNQEKKGKMVNLPIND